MEQKLVELSRLEQIMEDFFIKTVEQYNRWVGYVTGNGRANSLAHLREVEESLRLLFTLPLKIAMEGRKVRKEELDIALQKKLRGHSTRYFRERLRGGEIPAGKSNMALRQYESIMMQALVDLIEEDTILSSLTYRPKWEIQPPRDYKQIFRYGYKSRTEQLNDPEQTEVGLTDEAIFYLALKEGMGRILTQIEGSGKREECNLNQIVERSVIPCFALETLSKVRPWMEMAAGGYKARVKAHNLAIQLLPTGEETPQIYKAIRDRMHQKLNIDIKTANGLARCLHQLGAGQQKEVREQLKQAIKDTYGDIIDRCLNRNDTVARINALSRFFVWLAGTGSKVYFPQDYVVGIFHELSEEEVTALVRHRKEIEKTKGPVIDFTALDRDSTYWKLQTAFQGYQFILTDLADKGVVSRERFNTAQMLLARPSNAP